MMTGFLLAILSGMALGGISSFGALSYEYGADPFSLIALRGIMAAGAMAAITLMTKDRLITGRASLSYIAILSLALLMIGFGLMGAVAHISPSLAVAILYLYPILVLIADSIRAKTIPRKSTIAGFIIALIGIVTCLGTDISSLNLAGITLALTSALGMALLLLASATAQQSGHGNGVLVWANIWVMFVTITLIAILPHVPLSLPTGSIGWQAFIASSGLYALGLMFSILALKRISAPTVALLLNIEPLTTLIAARVLVDEVLNPIQYSGMIIAVCGIVIGSRAIRKRQ